MIHYKQLKNRVHPARIAAERNQQRKFKNCSFFSAIKLQFAAFLWEKVNRVTKESMKPHFSVNEELGQQLLTI